MAPDEVFLGDRCPVTSVYQRFYEFQYHPTDCNIRIEVLPEDRLLFVSKIIFKSKFSDLGASIPVVCAVPRKTTLVCSSTPWKNHTAHLAPPEKSHSSPCST
ncbi:placenta-specific protein 1-like [Phocoena sinus]|uniref:placenta-specific protein 1-like n=1 Tax=Phocoena sinus TaxID=42100 RepID=UPI0013C47B4B|nr:placenta-specific protein 1-like [Phocoena sinus]